MDPLEMYQAQLWNAYTQTDEGWDAYTQTDKGLHTDDRIEAALAMVPLTMVETLILIALMPALISQLRGINPVRTAMGQAMEAVLRGYAVEFLRHKIARALWDKRRLRAK